MANKSPQSPESIALSSVMEAVDEAARDDKRIRDVLRAVEKEAKKLPKPERRELPPSRHPDAVLSSVNDAIRDTDISTRDLTFLEDAALLVAEGKATARMLAAIDERIKTFPLKERQRR